MCTCALRGGNRLELEARKQRVDGRKSRQSNASTPRLASNAWTSSKTNASSMLLPWSAISPPRTATGRSSRKRITSCLRVSEVPGGQPTPECPLPVFEPARTLVRPCPWAKHGRSIRPRNLESRGFRQLDRGEQGRGFSSSRQPARPHGKIALARCERPFAPWPDCGFQRKDAPSLVRRPDDMNPTSRMKMRCHSIAGKVNR